jgi:hypothetical protein
MSRVLVIPDLHAPFQHPLALPFLIDVYNFYKCDRVVCLGDEVDWHSLSRFTRDPNGLSAKWELVKAREFLKELWTAFPVMQICTSNHTARPLRAGMEAGIPEEIMMGYKQALQAPDGVSWHDEIVIDGVHYFHGEPFTGRNAIINATTKRMQKVAFGHVHSNAGIQYFNTMNGLIWGMNCGWLGNEKEYAFAYGKKYPDKGVLGCGVIIHGRYGHFQPLFADLLGVPNEG